MFYHQISFFWEHLLLLSSKPFHQLLPHHLKDRAQKKAAKYESGIVLLQALAEHWNMAETNPPERRAIVHYSSYLVQQQGGLASHSTTGHMNITIGYQNPSQGHQMPQPFMRYCTLYLELPRGSIPGFSTEKIVRVAL
jgi:hypothetical protein